jgi:hypothetical protein
MYTVGKNMKKEKMSVSKGTNLLAPIQLQQSKFAGCIVKGGAESAHWAWDLLWLNGQPSYVKMKVLDTIRMEHGSICSWIFTLQSDGLVKSRQKARWSLPAVLEKGVDSTEAFPTPES